MRVWMLAVAIAVLALRPVSAGDAAGRRVLGFSPDGRVFAFEQFWMVYEEDASVSEIHLVDTVRDAPIPGSPVRVRISGDEGLDANKARADVAAKARSLVERYRASEPGTVVAATPSREIDDTDHYQLAGPFSPTISLTLPGGATARLTLTEHALGTRRCRGGDRSATPFRKPLLGYAITLAVEGQPARTIHRDARVPRSRGCPRGYGIAEAYLHTPAGQQATLVVLLEYADLEDGHLGPNRRFLAVPYRL